MALSPLPHLATELPEELAVERDVWDGRKPVSNLRQGNESKDLSEYDLSVGVTPTKRRRNGEYGDRFIPVRPSDFSPTSYALLNSPSPSVSARSKRRSATEGLRNDADVKIAGSEDTAKEEASRTFTSLLSTELFGSSSAQVTHAGGGVVTPPQTPTTPARSGSSHGKRLLHFSPSPSSSINLNDPYHARYSTTPISAESRKLLLSPRKGMRKVNKAPFKVLDAPDLADDFYLNLVDWSSGNILGVGLGSCVYLWSAASAQVHKLCDLSASGETVCSLGWVERGSHLAIGTSKGTVQIWDCNTKYLTRTMTGHSNRAGSLAWSNHVLSSGSRDKTILHRDVRDKDHYFRRLTGHKQEVCGLKWNTDENHLASGGNDNKLIIWDGAMTDSPLWKWNDHNAAVKALAWNPHQRGVLASGGGTQDRKIRFWNTATGVRTGIWDTGSQVCNLMFSKTTQELVSTHGYSVGAVHNQISLWRYPSMTQVASLTGHQCRVLYLAMSPGGETIVTGAGDETLRFWSVFPPATGRDGREDSEDGELGAMGKIR